MIESKSLVGYLWIQKWPACRCKLCCLSDRWRFPLLAFCSYSIFLKMAASFSMVALVDSPVRLLLKVFGKGRHWSWAYLWGTFSLPWGLCKNWGACSWTFSQATRKRCRGFPRSFALRNFLFAERSFFTGACWTLLSYYQKTGNG